MSRRSSKLGDLSHHPFRSMFDLMLALVFFLLTAVLLLKGSIHTRFVEQQKFIKQQVFQTAGGSRPILMNPEWKNDPVGTQRWVFPSAAIFQPNSDKLSDRGKKALKGFADALRPYQPGTKERPSSRQKWRRIRVEGHTFPPKPGQPENWKRSADMAIAVVGYFSSSDCRIPNHVLAGAFRGGQDTNTWVEGSKERVEVVIEFSNNGAN